MRTLTAALSLALLLSACSKKDSSSKPPAPEQPATPVAPPEKPAPDQPPAANGPHAAQLAELAKAANCDDPASPMRVWCIAATGWASGTAAALPDGDATMPGLTVELEDAKPVGDALTNKVTFSALALHAADGKQMAKITMVKPENDQEAQMTMEAVAALALVFKGKAPAAKLPPALAGYLSTLPAKADYELTRGDHGWSWTGASTAELRKVGENWVAIETPTEGATGIWVTIFTDKVAK